MESTEAKRTNLRLSAECLNHLRRIQRDAKLPSMTAAIELAAASYHGDAALEERDEQLKHSLGLLKKHINELRRSDYLILDLLNAMALEMDVSAVPMHHEKQFRSPALESAHGNLGIYLAAILTKNKGLEG